MIYTRGESRVHAMDDELLEQQNVRLFIEGIRDLSDEVVAVRLDLVRREPGGHGEVSGRGGYSGPNFDRAMVNAGGDRRDVAGTRLGRWVG